MSFKIIYNPEVYNDIRNAVNWYNMQQFGLGKRFQNTIKESLNFLKKYGFSFRSEIR